MASDRRQEHEVEEDGLRGFTTPGAASREPHDSSHRPRLRLSGQQPRGRELPARRRRRLHPNHHHTARQPTLNAIPEDDNGCGTEITEYRRDVKRPQGKGCDIGAYEEK